MGGVKGGGGSAQPQQTGKGSGGMPQPQGNMMGQTQGNVAGGQQTGMTPPNPAQQQQFAAMLGRMQQMRGGMGGGFGQGGMFRPPGDMSNGPPPGSATANGPGQGIAGLGNAMNTMMNGGNAPPMPNQADFMPGGSLAAPLDLANANPNPGGATPAGAMSPEAQARMQSAMGAQGMGGGWGRFNPNFGGMGGMRGGWGGGMGRFGGGMMGGWGGGRGMMNNGGIVSLADGGMLGVPVSRGGVSYAPAANPAPVAAPAPVVTPPTTATPARVSWTPTAAPSGNGGGMFNNVNVSPFTQPAAWTPPAYTAPIWQPPAKAVATPVVSKLPAQQTYGTYAPNSPGRMGSNR